MSENLPEFIVRSYGGGAVPAQLSTSMGSTDTSFTIVPQSPATDLSSWVQDTNGAALGTAGPFVVIIDRFTTSVEKIECASIDLTTGLVTVTVSGDYTGRGFDGTTAQSHYPGGSQAGVQTCWSAQEAYEANQVVAQTIGTAVTELVGQILAVTGDATVTWQGINQIIAGFAQEASATLNEVLAVSSTDPYAVAFQAPTNSVIGVSGAFEGSAPAAAAVKFQVGYVTGTAASGLLAVTFPVAFSSALVGISLSQISGPVAASIGWELGTTTGFTYTVNGAGSPYSGSIAFSYLAYGA